MEKSVRIAHWLGASRNYGDLAIQVSMEKLIREASPVPVEFLPISSHLAFGMPNSPAPMIDVQLVRYLNKTCNMLIVGGGGQLMSRPIDKTVSGWQFNITDEALEELKIPLVVYAIGYNKFKYEPDFLDKASDHLHRVKAKAVSFSVRNTDTRSALLGIGIEADKVVPDPAVFLEKEPVTLQSFCDRDAIIGLNWAGDATTKRFFSHEEEGDAMRKALATAHRVVQLTKRPGGILYIPHVSVYDFKALDVLRTKNYENTKIVNLANDIPSMYPEGKHGVPFLAGAYARCSVVLGMRGHANIIPYGQNVPVYGLGDHFKVNAFHKETGDNFKLTGDYKSDAQLIYDQAFDHGSYNKQCMADVNAVLQKKLRDYTKEVVSYLR